MSSLRKTDKTEYVEQTITADYILKLYEKGTKISDRKDKKVFLQDIKKLIPYLGKKVLLEL
tara:strand:+ start:6816 stop:6998 length:183 start_codon:yes stop_codon:yes gene_type:complete